MTRPSYSGREWDNEPREQVVASRLWAGGLATMLVAAGVGVVATLVIRGLLEIPILTPGDGTPLMNQQSATVPIGAGLAALAATGLLHLLLLTTPRPSAFFTAIGGLVVAILIVEVFLAGGRLEEQVATAVMYAAIGVVTLSLLSGVARTAVRHRPPPRGARYGGAGYSPPGYDDRTYDTRAYDTRDYDDWR